MLENNTLIHGAPKNKNKKKEKVKRKDAKTKGRKEKEKQQTSKIVLKKCPRNLNKIFADLPLSLIFYSHFTK